MNSADRMSVSDIRELLAAATGPALAGLIKRHEDDPRPGVLAAIQAAERREARRLAEKRRLAALYRLESDLHARGYLVVAGVDEVGRGALAGPLSACACVLPLSPKVQGIDDSKKLPAARRRELSVVIREVALCWSVAHVPAAEIDALGVTSALGRAMGRALSGLELEPDHVVVDGRPMGLAREETAVVKGDAKVAAVAAASILAKVTRDDLMTELDAEHPHYGFAVNKGYGTAEHIRAIQVHGLSDHHRRSFAPGGGTPPLF